MLLSPAIVGLNTLFSVAIFLGSFLLFLIEPIEGKRLLPLLGGSAAVWTTCLVFFQTSLMLGYLCAHFFATRLSPKSQWLYIVLLGAASIQLCATFGHNLHASTAHPIFSVFWLLAALIGMPFLALSAASPLLQSWYGSATTTGEIASPFHLFAVSNFGSLLALLAYPAVIEPRFTLRGQMVAWSLGFAIFAVMCMMIHRRRSFSFSASPHQNAEINPDAAPTVHDQLFWLLLAACSSLLLCAVTNFLSQNVAAVPLLWIMPLSVYLLSFIVAFNGRMLWPRWLAYCLLGAALGSASTVLHKYDETDLRLAVIPIFCAILFIICLFCHGEVYRLRPSARYSTSFYLCVSAGGAVGASFVGVLAPIVFSANYELFWGLVFVSGVAAVISWKRSIVWTLLWSAGTVGLAVLFIHQAEIDRYDTIVQTRNFYGALRVTETPYGFRSGTLRTLYNGTIEHGIELYGSDERPFPNTYYGTDSGVGLALRFCCAQRPRRVGVIGLGAGTLAAYGRSGDVFRFYEINPLVEQIAHNQFTYLSESDASIQIVSGDARISLAAEAPQQFDVLALDAFSGDAIPVHLLTTEAFELYRRHLKPDGILAVHVTNRYLDLAPVVQRLAVQAGLSSVLIISSSNSVDNIDGADWVLVSQSSEFFSRPEVAAGEQKFGAYKDLRPWTDDYNSLLPVVRWKPREEQSD